MGKDTSFDKIMTFITIIYNNKLIHVKMRK